MADDAMNDEMKEIIQDFLVESQEVLDRLDQRFVALEKNPDNTDLLNEIFRAAHSMKGSAGFLGFTRLVEVAHHAESIMNKMRQREMAVERPVVDTILEAFDVIKGLLNDIKQTGSDGHVDVSGILAKLAAVLNQAATPGAPAQAPAPTPAPEPPKKLGAILVEEGALSSEQLSDALTKQEVIPLLGEILVRDKIVAEEVLDKALKKQGPKPPGAEEDQTIRVETRLLDHVMNLVGDLVLGRNRMMKLSTGLEQSHESDPVVRELAETIGQLDLATSDLQTAVMKTRMIPMRKSLG